MLAFPMTVTLPNGETIHLGGDITEEEVSSKETRAMIGDLEVAQFVMTTGYPSKEKEVEWIRGAKKKDNQVLFAIRNAKKTLIGTTSINIEIPYHLGATGIMIWDKREWSKRIASTTHIARTWYAVNKIGLKIINSTVLQPNIASRKALESVGYFTSGYELNRDFRNGGWINRVHLQWIHPALKDTLVFDNLPAHLKESALQGIRKAEETLKKANKLFAH